MKYSPILELGGKSSSKRMLQRCQTLAPLRLETSRQHPTYSNLISRPMPLRRQVTYHLSIGLRQSLSFIGGRSRQHLTQQLHHSIKSPSLRKRRRLRGRISLESLMLKQSKFSDKRLKKRETVMLTLSTNCKSVSTSWFQIKSMRSPMTGKTKS